MRKTTKVVALDIHKDSTTVALAGSDRKDPILYGDIASTGEAITKLVDKLGGSSTRLRFCYEAGPCGYGVYRQLTAMGHECTVVAPSLIPRRPGERIKTDRRDALALARLHRHGELTAVWVPDEEQEAMRDLERCREDMKHSERRVRQRLNSFLQRHSRIYSGRSRWTQAHFRWLETQRFDHPFQQIVFQEYVDAVQQAQARVKGLDKELQQALEGWSLEPETRGMMALRGVAEAAWCYRFPARKTAALQRRAEQTTPGVQAIAWKAQKRLCGRYRHFAARGMPKNKACTAIARELLGFIWAIAWELKQPGSMARKVA